MASIPTSTTNATTGRVPDDGSWIHGCFVVKIGTPFTTYQAIMKYAQQDEIYGTNQAPALDPAVKQILNSSPGAKDSPLPIYFTKRKCRDTTLGGNDAINPLPQFGVDDDIAHEHFYDDTKSNVSMGQVYSENYDDLQQILYLGFGIPLFSNVGNFWATATDMELAGYINKGSGITVDKIGYLLGSLPMRIIQIATIPYKFIAAMANALEHVSISKYYSFSSQMPMYFRFVNTILVMLATNMNIVGSNDEIPANSSNTNNSTHVGKLNEGTTKGDDMSGISTVFRDSGLDMAKIMTKKYLYENGQQSNIKKRFTDEAVIEHSNKIKGSGTAGDNAQSATQSTNPTANETNSQTSNGEASSPPRNWMVEWFDGFASAYGGAIYDCHLFIGFRVDKGSGASESFSNSTGESQISQLANEKFQEGRENTFKTMHGDIGDGWIATAVGMAVKGARSVIDGLANSINMDPLAAVMSGSARIDIPEVWTSSSYSRSASFSITCLAPYGDFESIFQSEYVPMACLLAGALPRGTGHSSHSAPFVCQAYCRGIFSSPLCIIESLEITRGADQFGLNLARLPLKLSMNLTLKDLSPVMYMNMGGDQGIVNAIFGTDDNFGEYMLTLSGMGLRDRLSPFKMMRRKAAILLSTIHKNRMSPYMLGMEGGANFTISRLISTFVSSGRGLPGN